MGDAKIHSPCPTRLGTRLTSFNGNGSCPTEITATDYPFKAQAIGTEPTRIPSWVKLLESRRTKSIFGKATRYVTSRELSGLQEEDAWCWMQRETIFIHRHREEDHHRNETEILV